MDASQDKDINELTTEEFKSRIDELSIQFSYRIDPIGRVHIRQTGDAITGLKIDDEVEFYWKSPSMETDLIMKVAMELMRYCRGEKKDLSDIPIFVKSDDPEYLEFLKSIIEIPYGKVANIRKLKSFKFRYQKSLKDLDILVLIPVHRLRHFDLFQDYYFTKLREIEHQYF